MKKHILKLLSLVSLTIVAHNAIAQADLTAGQQSQSHDKNTGAIVVYIQAQEYEHPVKLWQYYKDYWFTQGPYVQEAATKVLSEQYASVKMCDASAPKGNLLLWLRPRMFYNPQSQVFYGKVTAVAYNASGKLLDTIVGEASQFGYLDVKPDQQLKQVYASSMQKLTEKMQTNAAINEALNANNQHETSLAEQSPCLQGQLLPEPRVQFMSF